MLVIACGHPAFGRSAPEAEIGEALGSTTQIEVTIQSEQLTLSAENAPLSEVLTAIAAEAGININLKGDFSTPITRGFSAVPLQQALARLLEGAKSVMLFGPADHAGARPPLVALTIYESKAPEAAASHGPATAADVDPDWTEEAVFARRAVSLGLGALPKRDAGLYADISILDRDGRIGAMGWLADLGDRAAVAALRHFLALDREPAVRSEAALALGEIGSKAAAKALELGMGDENPDVRFQVVEALGASGRKRNCLSFAQVLFGDPDPEVRMAAVAGLAQMDPETAQVFLEAASEDPHEGVRKTASHYLTAGIYVDLH